MNDRYAAVPAADGTALEEARQKALDRITTLYASGDMSLEEYESKAESIQRYSSAAELTRDFPEPRSKAPQERRPEPRYAGPIVEARAGSPGFNLCVMGDRRLSGDWLETDQTTSLTIMGSTTMDLTETALPPGRLRIDAVAVMGELRIIVPQGVPVKMSAFPLMGEAQVKRDVPQRVLDRNQPWVEVSGIALMGSIVVKSS